MEILRLMFAVILFLALLVQVNSINPIEEKASTKPPPSYNPLEDLILNQDKNGFKPGALSRVKRQYPYYYDRYPYPIPIIIGGGFGGFGGYGFGGRGFGGRGFGGRGFGGRGFGGRGFGGRGFGGRGFGGRGFGGGFGGRGGGFGGRGGGFGGGGRGGRG